MSYLERRLAPSEQVVSIGRFHFFQKLWPWLALLLLGILVIGIVIWARELYRIATTEMMVTNRRVILKKGWLSTKVDELNLESIEGAHVEQSILGRLFGYGKLSLTGRGDTELQFPSIDRPGAFRASIEEARMHPDVDPQPVYVEEMSDAQAARHEQERARQAAMDRPHRHAH